MVSPVTPPTPPPHPNPPMTPIEQDTISAFFEGESFQLSETIHQQLKSLLDQQANPELQETAQLIQFYLKEQDGQYLEALHCVTDDKNSLPTKNAAVAGYAAAASDNLEIIFEQIQLFLQQPPGDGGEAVTLGFAPDGPPPLVQLQGTQVAYLVNLSSYLSKLTQPS